jgi:hypothetical protein
MNSKKEDIKLGELNETKAIPIISSFLNTTLTKDTNRYATFDFFNDPKTIYVELKSRRIKHDKYETALIGLNKVNWCKDPNINYYFVWLYNDGIYYLKYDKELFRTFRIEKDYLIKMRFDVGRFETSSVVHIPTNLLNKIPNIEFL